MSLDNAKRSIDAASNDQALQQRLAAAGEPAEVARLAVQAGSERGLSFTTEELLASIGPLPGGRGGEIGDDQLEAVSGGTGAALSPEQLARRRWIYSVFKPAS